MVGTGSCSTIKTVMCMKFSRSEAEHGLEQRQVLITV